MEQAIAINGNKTVNIVFVGRSRFYCMTYTWDLTINQEALKSNLIFLRYMRQLRVNSVPIVFKVKI